MKKCRFNFVQIYTVFWARTDVRKFKCILNLNLILSEYVCLSKGVGVNLSKHGLYANFGAESIKVRKILRSGNRFGV